MYLRRLRHAPPWKRHYIGNYKRACLTIIERSFVLNKFWVTKKILAYGPTKQVQQLILDVVFLRRPSLHNTEFLFIIAKLNGAG